MNGLNDWYISTDEDVEVINVVVEDTQRNPAQPDDALEWATYHGLTWVTVADHEETWVPVWGDPDDSKPQQSYTVLGSDGVIVYHDKRADGSTVGTVTSAVESAP